MQTDQHTFTHKADEATDQHTCIVCECVNACQSVGRSALCVNACQSVGPSALCVNVCRLVGQSALCVNACQSVGRSAFCECVPVSRSVCLLRMRAGQSVGLPCV